MAMTCVAQLNWKSSKGPRRNENIMLVSKSVAGSWNILLLDYRNVLMSWLPDDHPLHAALRPTPSPDLQQRKERKGRGGGGGNNVGGWCPHCLSTPHTHANTHTFYWMSFHIHSPVTLSLLHPAISFTQSNNLRSSPVTC